MAVLGREAASQAMTSADIVDGAFTLNDLNFTDVPTNLDITGTIDKNTMRLAEGVTVIGDVTISDDLVLAKLSDDGVGITMTTDGTTRTITGSGSIESTTIAQTHSPSLTGMTGTVQASALTNATFPAGHVIQTTFEPLNGGYSAATTGSSLATFSLGSPAYDIVLDTELPQASLTTLKANSKILIICCIANAHVGSSSPYANMNFERIVNGTRTALVKEGELYGLSRMGPGDEKSLTTIFLDEPDEVAGTILKYGQVFYVTGGTMNFGGSSNWSSMTLMEIAP